MKAAPTASAHRARLLRALAYYVVMAGLVFVLVRSFPVVEEALIGRELGQASGPNPFGDQSAPVGSPVAPTPWAGGLLGAISMLGALAIMVPVTWIYMVTRRHRGFDESVVHALLILPVAITGIVMIVRDSVALAFSLAGIVAAVRFRTTLDDTKDAVYIFLAIGVGLASGVQAVDLALALSVVFNAVVLVLWATRFANPYAAAGPGQLGLGDALAGPGSSAGRRLVGDPALLDAAAPRDVAETLERAARLERHLSEERGQKKTKRANVLLLVSAAEVGAAQAVVEPVLEELTTRWKLAEVAQAPGGGWVMEYLARVDGATTEGLLVDRVRQAGTAVGGVELRSLQGLKGRA
ncbi:MAG: DUF4956 domain-containing protein [Longimicrobiales bacterium]|nr:DUF4956 domain-containing protein [Longimicrobiales bacterium]